MNEKIWGEVRVQGKDGLDKDIDCEVLVIGGGIAGYLCAYKLQNDFNVVLVEKDTLFSKTTHKTTAFITPIQGAVYATLIKKYGKDVALGYYNSQREQIKEYKDIIEKDNIDCDFNEAEGFLYTVKEDKTWRDELKAYDELNIEYEHVVISDDVIKKHAAKAIKFKDKPYQFNPIKFLNQLDRKFDVYEHTKIVKIDKSRNIAHSDNGHKIRAKHIVVATNFPIFDIPGFYFAKAFRSVSYVAITKVDQVLSGQWTGTNDSDYYYRNLGDSKVIFGGLDHKTGRGKQRDHYGILIKENYPQNEMVTTYNTIDTMTFDRIPFIGRIGNKNLYVITAFNKYGMANSMLASSIIYDLLSNKQNKYEFVVSTKRPYLRSFPFIFTVNMLTNVYYILKQFIGIPLKTSHSVKKGSGDVVWYKGRKVALYKDHEGKVHYFSSRCTHFNCQIKWNSTENCFECPCHGSRYDVHGKVIYEPAVFDKKEKEAYYK